MSELPTKSSSSSNPFAGLAVALGRSEYVSVEKINDPKVTANKEKLPVASPEITPESVSEYYIDRSLANYNLIKEKNPFLARFYVDAVKANQELRMINVCDKDIKHNANFSCLDEYIDPNDNKKKYRPSVQFNFTNPETYICNPETEIEPGIENLLRQIAIKVGAKDEDVLKNKKLTSTFIFMHELGHAKEFMINDLLPKRGKNIPLNVAVKTASTEHFKKRIKNLSTLPIPRERKQGETGPDILRAFKNRFTAMDIHNQKELVATKKRMYREMEDEKYADNFAEKFIMDHYDDFFLKPDETQNRPNRIKTGGLIMMDNDFSDLLGLRSGKSISLEKIAGSCSSQIEIGFKKTNFLINKLEIGKPIVLGNGDPANPPTMQSQIISAVFRQRDKNGQNNVQIYTKDGSMFRLRINEAEPPKFPISAETLAKDLQIQTGSEIQLLKKEIKNGSKSNIDEGKILAGSLAQPIQVGKQIFLSDKSGSYSTTIVKGIRKCWKSYFVTTSTDSVYEVIPMSN